MFSHRVWPSSLTHGSVEEMVYLQDDFPWNYHQAFQVPWMEEYTPMYLEVQDT